MTSAATPPFSWLHLTDLHQGMQGQGWLWPSVREAFFEDLDRLRERCGPWDVVLFTGDLTQRGASDEFAALDDTLDELFEHLAKGGSTPALLAVPGNHDLVRPRRARAVHRMLADWAKNPGAHDELWSDSKSEYREAIEALFAPYQRWWAGRRAQLPEAWTLRDGLLPGDWSLTIPHGADRIGILGLNSSYVQLAEGDFEGKLHLDVRQFHGACDGDGPRWCRDNTLSLLLTHHGPDWLGAAGREQLRGEIDVPPRFFAHLHGHVHTQAQYVVAEGGGRPRRRWQGPSLFGLEWIDGEIERAHGFTAGRIEFAEDSARVRLWPRSAVKTQAGYRTLGVDREMHLEEDGGTRAEVVELRSRPRPRPRPDDAFVAEQQELEQRLFAGGSVPEFEAAIENMRERLRVGPELEVGELLGGRYQLLDVLGSGGFAEVWAAYDRSEQRPVVVKALHQHWCRDRARAERFERGARQMRELPHRAIVPILADVARDEHRGRQFYVMRWLSGGNLRRALATGRIDRDAALEALARALEGLAHAHEAGLIHRDVKPSNILLDEESRGWLSDFDLVRGSESALHTRTGGGVGTVAYAAPEILEGVESTDARADVYSAGMCALFVLAGRDPPLFVATIKPKYIDDLACTERLREAVRRAVGHEHSERSETCRELIDAIRGGSGARTSRAEVLSPSRRIPDWAAASGADDSGRWAAFRVGGVEQRMRWIEPGTFMMGSPPDEPGRWDHEGPQHQVTLTQGYWLAETPCTQALWEVVMGANPSGFKSPRRPVEMVSWDDVQVFLERLNERMPGLAAELPTEAQWEYACRAGTTTATYAGPIELRGERDAPVLDAIAWYGGNSGVGYDLDHGSDSSGWKEKQHPHTRAGTREVGTKRANSWGLQDMLGNVWEWCTDAWTTYPDTPLVDPTQPSGRGRVIRGGGWFSHALSVRAACRYAFEPGLRHRDLGVRLVRGQGPSS